MTNEKNHGEMPTHLIRALKSIGLSSDVHTRMRADLSSYADLYDVPASPAQVFSPRSMLSAFAMRSRSVYAGALALVVMIAGGSQITSAAEGAVPGDILYPIKVSVAEPLALALSGSERKAEYAAQFASRRVDEAATLSESGKLDEKTAEDLAVRFEKHVDTVTVETGALEADGDMAFSLAIRTDLEQKIASRVDSIASEPVASAKMAAQASLEADRPPASSGIFAARISEKSKQLTTTRDHVETVLALDANAVANAPVSLAALREAAPAEAVATRLFTAKAPSEQATAAAMADAAATTTATSTATTTVEGAMKAPEPGSARFFMPFLKR